MRKLILVTSLLAVFSGLTAMAKARPNIILMMADDLGWGDVGFNGGAIIQTPHLDAMAEAGLKFDRFYAAAPVCSPTRGSCLTGRHPFRYGIHFANDGHLREGEWTLAELLKEQGYRTGHFGKWHLGTLSPDYSGKKERDTTKDYATPGMNGFDEWFSTEFAVATWDPYDPANSHLGKNQAPDTRALYWHNGVNVTGGLEGDDSRIILDKALPFIESAVAAAQPFFTVIWFHTPHAPVVGGPEYRARYAQYDEDAQHYYAAVTAMDEQVGRLRAALRELNVAENTLLFFCSDNGPEGDAPGGRTMGSAGPFKGRKRSLFEGGIRVPALLEWPAVVKPGTVTDYPAVTSDYLPTVLEVLGVSMPDARPLDGLSLMPAIRDGATERPAPIAFETRGGAGTELSRQSPRLALMDNRYKLLTDLSEGGAEDLLFDSFLDPSEAVNIALLNEDRVRSMRAMLGGWRESCASSAAGDDYVAQVSPLGSVPEGAPFRAEAARAREVLLAQWPALSALDESAELERQALLTIFRDGYGTEVDVALETLTRDGERFLRNCDELLDIVREKAGKRLPTSSPFGPFAAIANRLRALPEADLKQAVTERFLAFRRSEQLPEAFACQFDRVLFAALYRRLEWFPVIPEYGDWGLISLLAEHLRSGDDRIRRTAAANLYGIATSDLGKRDAIVYLFRRTLPDEDMIFGEPLGETKPAPQYAGIPSRQFEALIAMDEESFARESARLDRVAGFRQGLEDARRVEVVPEDFEGRLKAFMNGRRSPVFLESWVRTYLSASDLPQLHTLLKDEEAGNDWWGILFAVSVLEEDQKALEFVKSFVATPRYWKEPGYIDQEASRKNRSVVLGIRNLAMVDPELSGPFFSAHFSQEGAYRFLHRWAESPLPQGVTLERPLASDFLAGLADAMLHSQSRELYRTVEQTYEALASKGKEDLTEFDYELLSVCRESMALRDLYLDLGWDAGVRYLNSIDDWEAKMYLILSYSTAYISKVK